MPTAGTDCLVQALENDSHLIQERLLLLDLELVVMKSLLLFVEHFCLVILDISVFTNLVLPQVVVRLCKSVWERPPDDHWQLFAEDGVVHPGGNHHLRFGRAIGGAS
jgi:hypothetical protein